MNNLGLFSVHSPLHLTLTSRMVHAERYYLNLVGQTGNLREARRTEFISLPRSRRANVRGLRGVTRMATGRRGGES